MIFCALPTSLSNQSIEEKDQTLHTKVKAILHDCKKRNDHFHLGYEYLTTSMRVALKHLLLEEEGHDYWNAVEQKLAMMLEEQQNKQNETCHHDSNYSSYDWGYDHHNYLCLGRTWFILWIHNITIRSRQRSSIGFAFAHGGACPE